MRIFMAKVIAVEAIERQDAKAIAAARGLFTEDMNGSERTDVRI